MTLHFLVHLLIQETEAQHRGSTTKLVVCEQCGAKYTYELTRTGRGQAVSFLFSGDGKPLASRRARTDLAQALAAGCEPVPCPACGWYQADMIWRARQLRYRWMKSAGVAMLALAVLLALGGVLAYALAPKGDSPLALAALVLWMLAGMAAVLVPGLPILRYFLNRNYDPNNDLQSQPRSLGRLI